MENKESQYVAQPDKNPTKKRSYNVRPTPRHYRAVAKILENPRSTGQALRDAGYSHNTAIAPRQVTESKGFIKALNSAGLDLDTLNSYLSEDLEKKKQNRFQELQLAYKLHGKLKDTKEGDKTLILNITGESASRYKLDNKDEG